MNPTLALAIALIEEFEGIEQEAYLDPIGIPTICAGLTRYPDGTPVQMGDTCSGRVCAAYLQSMLEDQYIPALGRIPGWERLGKCRKAALISFAWNLGRYFYDSEGFETISSVLKRGAKNPEAYDEMPTALAKYVYAGGKPLEGLKRRRAKEGEIWNQERDGTMIYSCIIPTFLKKAPIQSRYLSDEGKIGYETGESIEVVATDEIPADSHQWVTLKESGERWAIYGPHWIIGTDQAEEPSSAEEIDWSNFNAKVSDYLTVGEILQWDLRRRPQVGSEAEKNIIAIAAEFDLIREAWGGPIGVTSAYRPEPINREVGGVPGSFHVKGQALDIFPIQESCAVFHKWLSRRWSGGLGDGCYRGFVHIDTRDGGKFHRRADARPACAWGY